MNKINSSAGYTLIEILLAIIIMAFFILAVNSTYFSVNNLNYISKQKNYAVDLSQQIIEIIQGGDTDLASLQGENDFKDISIFSEIIVDSLISRFDDVSIEIDKFKHNNQDLEDVYQVDVKVNWINKERIYSYNLSSLVYIK